MNKQYFEAILQLRNTGNKHFLEAAERVGSATDAKGRADIFITKVEKVKGGIDFYLSSKKFAKSLGVELTEAYGGEFQANPRLFSRNRLTSKDVYRVNVLVRLPDVEKGSVIRRDRDLLLVSGFGKNIYLTRNLMTGKSVTIPIEKDCEIVFRPQEQFAVVTTRKPNVEVLHPDNFESVRVENLKTTKKDKLKIALIDGKIYDVS